MATTVQIPGGEAELLDNRAELTPRRRREIELIAARVGRKVEAAQTARRILCEGDLIVDNTETLDDDGKPAFTGADVELSESELRLLGRLNDAIAWALLKSWTLEIPLPKDPDELLDIPGDVYDVLRQKAAEVNAALGDGGFTVDAVEDRTSPTGDSGA
jgi:hypothetical protein